MIREIFKDGKVPNYNLNPKLCDVMCNCSLALLLIQFVGLIKESRLKHALVYFLLDIPMSIK